MKLLHLLFGILLVSSLCVAKESAVLSVSIFDHQNEGVYVIGFTDNNSLNEKSREWFDLALRDRREGYIHSCSPRLALTLAEINRRIGGVIRLHSGYRTDTTNEIHDGVDNSHHLNCTAADVSVEGVDQKDLAAIALLVLNDLWGESVGGIGVYESNIHLDIGSRRFWVN